MIHSLLHGAVGKQQLWEPTAEELSMNLLKRPHTWFFIIICHLESVLGKLSSQTTCSSSFIKESMLKLTRSGWLKDQSDSSCPEVLERSGCSLPLLCVLPVVKLSANFWEWLTYARMYSVQPQTNGHGWKDVAFRDTYITTDSVSRPTSFELLLVRERPAVHVSLVAAPQQRYPSQTFCLTCLLLWLEVCSCILCIKNNEHTHAENREE